MKSKTDRIQKERRWQLTTLENKNGEEQENFLRKWKKK